MKRFASHYSLPYVIICSLFLAFPARTHAEESASSGLKLPRFVSIVFDEANMRVGPGTQFPVKWQYRRAGMPLEVISEYDQWREIRDRDGVHGWMHVRLLSGTRYGLVTTNEPGIPMRRDPEADGYILAFLRHDVIVKLNQCLGDWCGVSTTGLEGWVQRSHLWGIYPDEMFD